MENVFSVLVSAREGDKFVDWDMLMKSCGTVDVSRNMLELLERRNIITVRRGDTNKVILTFNGYHYASGYLAKGGN